MRPAAAPVAPVRRSAAAPPSPRAQDEEPERRYAPRARPTFAIIILALAACTCFAFALLGFQQVAAMGDALQLKDASGESLRMDREAYVDVMDSRRNGSILFAAYAFLFGFGALLANRNPRGATLTCAILFTPIPLLFLLVGSVAMGASRDAGDAGSLVAGVGMVVIAIALVVLAAVWGAVWDGFRVAKLRRLAARRRGGSRGIRGGRGVRGVY